MLRRSFVSFVFCHASPPYTGVGVKFEKDKHGKKVKAPKALHPSGAGKRGEPLRTSAWEATTH